MMRIRRMMWGCLLPVAAVLATEVSADQAADKRLFDRGRYLVQTSGCNDCHTPGYPQTGGKTPQSEWLTGNPVGFSGPWGTTYPANLRLLMQTLSEQQWLAKARAETRPPMPWFALRDMSDDDLRALYRFVRNLGAKGEAAPAYVPPGQVANTPYIEFVPKNLRKQASTE